MNKLTRIGIAVAVWLLMSIFYYNMVSETGRILGVNIDSVTTSGIKYTLNEMARGNSLEDSVDRMTDEWLLSESLNTETRAESLFQEISVYTILYVIISIGCYHFAVVYKPKEK